MADKVLIVPGTSGTKLLLDGNDSGWPGLLSAEAWLCGVGWFGAALHRLGCSADDLVSIMSMEFAAANSTSPTKTCLKDGSSVASGAVLETAYNQFAGVDFFSYDWRSDIRDSAAKLLNHLEANKPANGKWKLLAHSQGGLLLPVAARLLGTRGGAQDTSALSRLVSHIGFCGVPFYGTINAADALASGLNLGEGFSTQFLRIARTWPSLYQMLASWPGSAPSIGDPNGTLLDDAPWDGLGLDAALLDRARTTRQTYLRHPLVFLGGVKLRITMSVAHPTKNNAARNGGALVTEGDERGDTLVAYDSTRAAMNDVERQATYAIGAQGDTAVHFMLLNDPVIATDMRQFLST